MWNMFTNAPRGTNDILGDYMLDWKELENTVRWLCHDYGYNEIRTPMFEHTELFARGVGETTDIVQKEMYNFKDKKGRDICLKPEGTAGVVRAYLGRKLYAEGNPTKLYYIAPAFRYGKPQAGRLRQFHQFGVELFGSDSPAADAEIIALGASMLNRLGITNVKLHINSLGDTECRKHYNSVLKGYFQENLVHLCPTCQDRFKTNPLRILDCKEDSCKIIIDKAPNTIDHLGEGCKAHFNGVLSLLDAMKIDYMVDPRVVRGLDYYTKTVFEFVSNDIGAQGTVCGGGRYNRLIEECGGDPTPAVGFGAGIERLLMTREAVLGKSEYQKSIDVYIGSFGEETQIMAAKLVEGLRKEHIQAEMDLLGRSVKAQMKYANKIGARYAIIIGDSEMASGKVNVKNMNTKDQTEISFDGLIDHFKKIQLL